MDGYTIVRACVNGEAGTGGQTVHEVVGVRVACHALHLLQPTAVPTAVAAPAPAAHQPPTKQTTHTTTAAGPDGQWRTRTMLWSSNCPPLCIKIRGMNNTAVDYGRTASC